MKQESFHLAVKKSNVKKNSIGLLVRTLFTFSNHSRYIALDE